MPWISIYHMIAYQNLMKLIWQNISAITKPRLFEEALTNPGRIKAMQEEISAHEENNT